MDVELVVQAQRGDEAAFARLAGLIEERFHGVAYGILRDVALAEDAVQGALLSIWRDLPGLREPAAFEAWSYRLLVRACYAESRRRRRWLPGILARRAAEPSIEGGLAVVVDRDQIERGFRRLPLEQRSVLVLHHYLDMTVERVAATLGIPEGTARSRLHRGTQALRSALEADARAPRPMADTLPPEAAR